MAGRGGIANAANPGYVYEVEFKDHDIGTGTGLELLDPVKELAATLAPLLVTPSYQHDGDRNLLLGVVRPARFRRYLTTPPLQPPGVPGSNSPQVTLHLKTLLKALQDAEILALGNIPASCVKNSYPAY